MAEFPHPEWLPGWASSPVAPYTSYLYYRYALCCLTIGCFTLVCQRDCKGVKCSNTCWRIMFFFLWFCDVASKRVSRAGRRKGILRTPGYAAWQRASALTTFFSNSCRWGAKLRTLPFILSDIGLALSNTTSVPLAAHAWFPCLVFFAAAYTPSFPASGQAVAWNSAILCHVNELPTCRIEICSLRPMLKSLELEAPECCRLRSTISCQMLGHISQQVEEDARAEVYTKMYKICAHGD